MAVSGESVTPLLIRPHPDDRGQLLTDGDGDTQLDASLRGLENFLRIFGFCQYSPLSFVLSWLSFLALAVLLPFLIIEFSYCANCEKYEIRSFELEILVCQALAAAISLLCVSHNLRKYGVRKFLFVDRTHGHLAQFRDQYLKMIRGFFRLLLMWVVPCFIIKTAREVLRIIYTHDKSWWPSVLMLFALLFSWAYSTIIFLSGSALFNLVCNFQVIHFENFGKLLEEDRSVSAYIEEHIRLTHHLSKISHRFRIYLLFEFLVVTASQFVALLQTTGNRGIINFLNGCDFVISSVVQLVGIVVCLHAAAKISHRAQSLGSVASRWHAIVTSSLEDASLPITANANGNTAVATPSNSLPISYSESDLEAVDYVPVPTNSQLASYMTSYHKRQAFVTYLQTNPGGASIFGWTVDRVLINTLFFMEMALVLFVLGKTITITTK
uniref:Gustatory receptor n=1 Tax=Kalanchoe fedtschenkoi TaxID=63787 RepID=A0A7N0RIS9_KALFE